MQNGVETPILPFLFLKMCVSSLSRISWLYEIKKKKTPLFPWCCEVTGIEKVKHVVQRRKEPYETCINFYYF